MNEEYYRANFSSATSTYQTKDSDGNRLAILDIQLPSSLLDPESEIQEASVMLTKASIPLGQIPKAELDVDEVSREGQTNIYTLTTKYGFYIGNYFYSSRLNRNSGGLVNRPFPSGESGTFAPNLISGAHSALSKGFKATSKDEAMMKYAPISYTNLTLLENDLNKTLESTYSAAQQNVRAYNNAWSFPRIKIHFESDIFKILIEKLNWNAKSFNNMRPLCGNSDYSGTKNYFSICISEALAELLHGIPLVDVSSYYDEFVAANIELQKTYGKYAIILENLIPSYENDDNGNEFEVFSFHFFNPLSLSPLSSIVIYSSNFPIEGQTHGIASETGTTLGSAQTSSMYILDVFYPLLTSEKDLEDVLIISKDAVTNTAPAKISPSALTFMHNITFNFAYITKKGYLRPIIIPPNANLSFQLTFILYS